MSPELVEVVEVPLRDAIVFDYELQEALVGKRSMAPTFTESEHIDLLFLMDGPVERFVDFHPPFGPLLLLDHVLQVEGEPTNVVTRRLIDRGVPSSAAVQEDDALVGDVLEQLREVGTQAVQQDVLVLGVCQVELEALPLLAESLEEVREPVAVPGASRRLLQALQAKSEEAYLLALRHCRLAGSDPCVIYHVRQLP